MEALLSPTLVLASMPCSIIVSGRRQLGYMLHYNDNIEALEMQYQRIRGMRANIQAKIDAAIENKEIISPDVQNWLLDVDTISSETEKFLEYEDKENKRCFKRWCIDPRLRYKFSKKAVKMTMVIDHLREQGHFQNVSHPTSGTFESRESIKKEIMEALNDDRVSIIGIYGTGGVGKTTLVKEIGKQANESNVYDAVVMTVVSQTANIHKIQGDIASMLGLTLSPDNSETARACPLWDRIKEDKRILIILDDIWKRIKMDKIGIPIGKKHGGCKVVLTSRSKNVCVQMGCQKIFTVGSLSEQESWVLFKELAGPDIEDSSDIRPIAQEIVASCDGLPIAIVTVTRALKNKGKHVWVDAARQLQKSPPLYIEGVQGNVISSLELSYNYLESEEAKALLLFCSLFPEDFKIPIEDLVGYAVGLRLFKNVDTVDEVRDRAHAIVSTLTTSFLLIGENYCGKVYVKMHDVIRDFMLVIASKDNMFMVKAGIRLQEWPNSDLFEDLTAISLMSNDIQVVPEGLEFPKLQILLLQGNSKLVLPTTFFQQMKDLKVLDLSGTELLPLPNSLSTLTNLRTLYLNDCKLGDLSIIGQLRNLEILSLNESTIEEIPISFSQLSRLRLLDLSGSQDLKLIPHNVISCFHKLEELYLRRSFKHWDYEKEGNLRSNVRIADLHTLTRLTTLHIGIPNLDLLSNDIFCQSLTNFIFEIGHDNLEEWDTKGYSRCTSFLDMRISKKLDCFKNLLKRTQNLYLGKISGLENVLTDLAKEELSELKSLTVQSCDEIKYLVNTLEGKPIFTFKNLEELIFSKNPNLVEICHAKPPTQCFNKLRSLYLVSCPMLIKVFSPALLQNLISLKKIEINDCKNLQEIFGKKEEEIKVEWKKDDIITSPSLGNLMYLCINCCGKLKNLFTFSIAKSLVKLKTLKLSECATLVEIITDNGGEKGASTEEIVFANLYELEFEFLDSLTCFGLGMYTIKFPALEKLEIWACPSLKTFGYGDQMTPKLNKVWIEGECRWNGNLNATIQQFFHKQNVSSYMGVSHHPESRQSITSKIMETLNDDNVHIIGVCGMGGVGKTILVKEIAKVAKEAKLYDAVVMVVFSQNPSILKIQGDIEDMLADFELRRAGFPWKEKRLLFILDDVWRRFELDKIGIPFGKEHGGCKVILTSRIRDVCNQMGCQKIFVVESLSKQESWLLFKEFVGLNAENSDINPIARDIAANCGGLPIAIVTIARALKNKTKYVWIDAAQELQKSIPSKIEGMYRNMILSLKLSYDFLESEEAKSFFLFCSLFPKDFEIPVEVLVRYGMGLRCFKNVETMEDFRYRAHDVVSTLVSSFLLIHHKENDDDEEYVKMNSIIRDFAHVIASRYNKLFMVKAGIGLLEWPGIDTFEDLTCISLMSNNIKEVPDRLECPTLRCLLLQRNSKLVVPNNFFQGMKDLKVLDLSENQLLHLPQSLSLLASLRTLYLDNCEVGDLFIIGQLRKLEILSLCDCNIREIPISFSQLSQLRLLDLKRCERLTLISPGVITCLRNLEELNMVKSFSYWDSGSNAKLVELQHLHRLTSLKICIPNLDILTNNDMPFKNLTCFTIIIGVPDESLLEVFLSVTRKYSRNVMLSDHDIRISKFPDTIESILKRTETLFISGLKTKKIYECPGMKSLDYGDQHSLEVNKMELEEQCGNINLHAALQQIFNKICHGYPPVESFSELKLLEIVLLNVVPSHLLSRLQNLEIFKASACKSMEHTFDFEGLHIANGESKLFSSLKDLELIMLPKMRHVWNGDNQFVSLHNLKRIKLGHCLKLVKLFSPTLSQSLTSLERMEISYCSNLEQIFGTKEEDDLGKEIVLKKNNTRISPNLGNLTYIAISYCYKLKNLFNLSIVKSLVRLRILKLSHCSTIREIITNDEGEKGASTDRIVFPSLYCMELEDLDSLTCFYSGLNPIEFLALETLMICQCPKMKIFAYGDQLTPKLNKVCAKNVRFRISPISNLELESSSCM